jgi:phosphoglycolate phosphatase-like HAD superfamily hydrolase
MRPSWTRRRFYNSIMRPSLPRPLGLSAVLFDGSGTLFDDLHATVRSTEVILREYGLHPPTVAEFKRATVSPYLSYLTALGVPKETSWRILRDKFVRNYDEACVALFPDVRRCFLHLELSGVEVGIVSQLPRELLIRLVAKFDLRGFCSVLVGLEDVRRQKPFPDSLRYASRRIGLSASQVAYVGDGFEDVLAAKAAGVLALGIHRSTGSYQSFARLAAAGPLRVFRSLSQLSVDYSHQLLTG